MTINIDNPSLYRRCYKLGYNVKVARPEIGTCIINKFEQAQAYHRYKTDMIFPEDFCMLDEYDKTYLKEHASIVTEDQPVVVIGIRDEIWIISKEKLLDVYENLNGTPIEWDLISNEWVEVKTKSDINTMPITWCLHIPLNSSFVLKNILGTELACNDLLAEHGNGDYIVCFGDENGPHLNDKWVVNGTIFPNTYTTNIKPN